MNEDFSETREPTPRAVESFKTSKGSIYTLGPDGGYSRFKVKTGEQFEPQDLTIFVDLTPQQEEKVRMIFGNPDSWQMEQELFIIERQDDDNAKQIVRRSEVKNPERLYFGASDRGKWIVFTKEGKVSLDPQIGWRVYEKGRVIKDGEERSSDHLGHHVTEIKYKE